MRKTSSRTGKGITTINADIEINAFKEDVWNALKFIGEIEKFHPLVKASVPTTAIKTGLGAKRHCKLFPMGEMHEEAVEWEDGKSITMAVVGGKMLPPYRFMRGKINLHGLGERTRVTFSFSYQLKYGVVGRLMNAVLIKPQFKKAPPQYVKGLKEYVETVNG